MITFLAGLALDARAETFDLGDLPATFDFQYSWVGYPTGQQPFTFTNAAQTIPVTQLCNRVRNITQRRYCLTGDFSTGNSGTGQFTADLQYDGCIPLGIGSICAIRQDLVLTYDATGAVYTGSGFAGFGFRTNAGVLLTFNEPAATARVFSGALSGPGTGTWFEI